LENSRNPLIASTTTSSSNPDAFPGAFGEKEEGGREAVRKMESLCECEGASVIGHNKKLFSFSLSLSLSLLPSLYSLSLFLYHSLFLFSLRGKL